MTLEIISLNTIPVILIPERLDTKNAPEIEAELRSFSSGGPKKVVIDLSRTEYISSAGLRILLQLTRDILKTGGGIALCGLKPPVHKIFDMAGFTSIFKICATREDALNLLK